MAKLKGYNEAKKDIEDKAAAPLTRKEVMDELTAYQKLVEAVTTPAQAPAPAVAPAPTVAPPASQQDPLLMQMMQ